MTDETTQGTEAAPVETAEPAASWMDQLSEDSRALAQARSWDNPEKVIESYRNLESLRGVPSDRLVTLPSKDADPSAWDAVYSKLGRPETADGYELNLPAEVQVNPDTVNNFKEVAYKVGLTPQQANALAEWQISHTASLQSEATQQTQTALAAEEQELQREWGVAYDKNLGVARAAAKRFGASEDLIDSLQQSMGYSKTLKFFAEIGKAVGGEDAFESADARTSGFSSMTPAEAKQRINDLMMDQEFRSQYLSGSKTHLQQIDHLQSMASGRK